MQKEICGHGRFIKCKEECDAWKNVGMGGKMRKAAEKRLREGQKTTLQIR